MPAPNIKSRTFRVTGTQPGSRGTQFPATGNFIFVDTAAKPFEMSFDGIDFFPMKEGRVIQTRDVFDKVFIRSDSDAEGVFITGYGGVLNFSASGGGGGGGDGGPSLTQPFASYAELGNAATVAMQTGTLATVVNNGIAETWQLRAWASGGAPATDTGEGVIAPFDYSTANSRVWFRS